MNPPNPNGTIEPNVILRAIAVSSMHLPSVTSNNDRQEAFRVLQNFKNSIPHNLPLCLHWLTTTTNSDGSGSQRILYDSTHDITTATKLLALDIVDHFLKVGYSKLSSESDRLQLRNSILKSARVLMNEAQQATQSSANNRSETRILARKIALVLKGLIVRDFPQRWMTLGQDLFAPYNQGGLWQQGTDTAPANNATTTTSLVGVQICLETFKLVAEDCTDSDYNAKISTTRRNDVLIGLNEISNVFLPLLFQILQEHYQRLQTTKQTLHNMHQYILQQQQNQQVASIQNLTQEEAVAYQEQVQLRKQSSLLLADTLVTLGKFCASLPTTWMLGTSTNTDGTTLTKQDFVAAFLHLLREPDAKVQIYAIECLEQLSLRGKLDFQQWYRLIQELPNSFQQTNQLFTAQILEFRTLEVRVGAAASDDYDNDNLDPLTMQLDFHRALSHLLATAISSHISYLSSNKSILAGKGDVYDKIRIYLRLMVDMLHHASGRIGSEQLGMWSTLYRDSIIAKSELLHPLCSEIMTCYMDQLVRIRWDDVEEERHPQYMLLEASFDDSDEYDAWMMDLRSRTSLLFKFIGNTEPQIAAQVFNTRIQSLLAKHGNGAPFDNDSYVDPSNRQLTIRSEAVIQLEAIFHPFDNIMSGIPSWAMSPQVVSRSNNKSNADNNDRKREETRIGTRTALTELTNALAVNWKPTYVYLKFRHAALLEPLKYFWKHDPNNLLQGVDTLLRYLGLPDEWNMSRTGAHDATNTTSVSSEIVSLKKKSGVALVAVAKMVPQHLVPWLSQLSEATRSLLSSEGLIPTNQMHLYEFLSCVAAAVQDPKDRSNFIGEVLSGAVAGLEAAEIQQATQSSASLLRALGVAQAAERPESLTDPANVKAVTEFYGKLFNPWNRLLSVGRRCGEAAKKRSVLNGILIENLPPNNTGFGVGQSAFPPDEGPLSIQDLTASDPFAPLWPRILPHFLHLYEAVMGIWRPEHQALLLPNQYQRYAFAISDDEAYIAQNKSSKSGGVFGEGGTAGSVVAGTDRREINLVPKWSGWFNELRNTCFQLMGLLAGQRTLYAPEIASFYPRIVSVLTDSLSLKAMEHRHTTQFLKHVVELLLLSCPCSLYKTHLEPIIGPIFDHIRYRLEKTWLPVLSGSPTTGAGVPTTKALGSADCAGITQIASRGEEEWFSWYYAHAGLFVGDLDQVTAEAAVEKYRVDISRVFSDMVQTAFALRGDWALVLANQAKEEQAIKRNDSSILNAGPRNRIVDDGVALNADGTPKMPHQTAIDARKVLRINALGHFLLLESESIAGSLTLTVIQCLSYPDAYTCRRIVKICHRILETVAWSPQYSQLLGQHMFTQAVKNLVTEPKWMVGVEWDMINVVRDIYCRLVLGQTFQAGGQGPGLPQPEVPNNMNGVLSYEQAKTVEKPLQGGGILVIPSNAPRQVLASLPGVAQEGVQQFEQTMKNKRSAKDQKDCIRDLLRVAADSLSQMNPNSGEDGGDAQAASGIFDRAVAEESLLHAQSRRAKNRMIQDLPEKLVTYSQMKKQQQRQHRRDDSEDHQANIALFNNNDD